MNHETHEPNHLGREANYELNQVEHELVSKYQPKFLAKGGEHIVYEIPEHPDAVVKVSTAPLKKVIEWNLEHGQPISSLSPELESCGRGYVEDEAARYRQLKRYFGAEHVPSQKEFLLKVPITPDILNAVFDGKPPVTTDEVWSVAMVQRRVEALKDPERVAIISGYTEFGEVSADVYKQVTDHLIFGKDPDSKTSKETFLEMQSHNDLKALLKKVQTDEGLAAALRELVDKIILYAEETGEIFDLVGQDNLILSQKDGKWNYTLVDTRYPGEGNMIQKAKEVLHKLDIGDEISEHEPDVLLNVFNFVRTINGLAEQLGSTERINIVPGGAKLGHIDFLKAIRS